MITTCTPHQLSGLVDALPGIVFYCSDVASRAMDYLSEGCLQLTGYTQAELTTQQVPYPALIYAEDLSGVQAVIETAMIDLKPYGVEYRIKTKTGEERWLWEQGQIIRSVDQGVGLTGFITDITDRKHKQARLQQEAFYDPLTALPNRALFMDRLDHLLRHSQRHPGYCFAVLFLDLDRFKVINDSLGHSIGDQLLVAIAQKLQTLLRPGDTVARLGGDEFTMLIDNIATADDAVLVCDRILQEMSLPCTLEGRDVISTTSIGIALSSEQYQQPEDLLRDADIALYHAKASGKACYAFFNATMHLEAVARLDLETDLRRAIEQQELQLSYQPITALETGNLEGFEALLSWQHPQQGLIDPNDFLPVAEETGLMIPLGQWVLKEACTQLCQWQHRFPQAHDYFITVNLSSSELRHPDLIAQIKQTLADTQLATHCLKLEITESTILDKGDSVLARLSELRALGVQLCIDDFGTGYSSLSYLQSFPVNLLKVDQSFVQQLDNKENLEIVRAILNLAKTLDLQVIAEGVETLNQLLQLRALNCHQGQGYFLGRPLAVPEIEQLIEQESFWHENSGYTVSLPQLVIRRPSGQSNLLLAGRTAWTIGRGANNDIVLPDRMISRDHAMLLQVVRTGTFYFVDLWSRNGSSLNAQMVQTPQRLQDGDRIQVGKTELRFRLSSSAPSPSPHVPSHQSVLLIQTSHTQGDIWQHLLSAQGIEVLWQMADIQVISTLEQLRVCDEHLPNLLVLDTATLEPDPDIFLTWYRTHPELPLLLTHAPGEEPAAQIQALRESHIVEIVPHFPSHDLPAHQAEVTARLNCALQMIGEHLVEEKTLGERLSDIQGLLNHQTLH
jgi:diguanylate cyclase (GGDEF)-like protein/PAS domain S-box-containing protein